MQYNVNNEYYLDHHGKSSMTNQTNRYFDLSHLGTISIKGSGAKDLLQGQISCDVDKLAPGTGSLSVHCNPKGRIISLFYITKVDNEHFVLILPGSMLELTTKAFAKYAPFYRSEIIDSSDDYTIIGRDIKQHANHFQKTTATLQVDANREMILISSDATLKGDFTFESTEIWQLENIRNKLAWIYPETSTLFLPHELNLHQLNAIDFDKGCFTGQEIIARMHYRGKSKKDVFVASTSNTVKIGDSIHTKDSPELEIGKVVDSCADLSDDITHLLISASNNAPQLILYTNIDNLIKLEPTQ